MKNKVVFYKKIILITLLIFSVACIYSSHNIKKYNAKVVSYHPISRIHKVTLREAHQGSLDIDTKLLDSYGLLPENIRKFYFNAREVFSENLNADFSNDNIVKAAQKFNIPLMGGPMLGNLNETGVTIWLRPSTKEPLLVKVSELDESDEKIFLKTSVEPGVEQRIVVNGLSSDAKYKYEVYINEHKIADGEFTTAPASDKKDVFKLAFGSCFHKIGLHNLNLINQILNREPRAMILLGDIAVDDRDNLINMHRSDYLLRDLSNAWQQLAANVPLYTSWDDHDYLNDDLGGVPEGFNNDDRDALRSVWRQNWNNPVIDDSNIYFNQVLGPVEMIILDTRSFRENKRRGEYGSYLGVEQLKWLKETLKKSKAPFKVISSGTMWSDFITPGKDSWGTWDTEGREELFSFIEEENISGVLLISGDRHGARAFTIPRPSGFEFYEFQVASLGGVPGPVAIAEDSSSQLFGYLGKAVIAFGEFTFDTTKKDPLAIFRLIDESGDVIEEHRVPYDKLSF